MIIEVIVAVLAIAIVVMIFGTAIWRRLPKRIKSVYYIKKWREIQKLCKSREDWCHAIIHADMLLDEVMVKKRISGKTMGERMVAAQDKFSNNEVVWTAHKFACDLRDNGDRKIQESKIKDTLVAFRQALRDLGAL